MPKLAFLGLGIMGTPMAVNPVKADLHFTGWNRASS